MNDTLTLRRITRVEDTRADTYYLGVRNRQDALPLVMVAHGAEYQYPFQAGSDFYSWGYFSAVYEIPEELGKP